MALCTIFITGLTTKSLYADIFSVNAYSDAGATSLVATSTCSAYKINSSDQQWQQAGILVLPALTVGTTYYLKAGIAFGNSYSPSSIFAFTPTATESSITLQQETINVVATYNGTVFAPVHTVGQGTDVRAQANVSGTAVLPSAINHIVVAYRTNNTTFPASDTIMNGAGTINVNPSNKGSFTGSVTFSGLTVGDVLSVYIQVFDCFGNAYGWALFTTYTVVANPSASYFHGSPVRPINPPIAV